MMRQCLCRCHRLARSLQTFDHHTTADTQMVQGKEGIVANYSKDLEMGFGLVDGQDRTAGSTMGLVEMEIVPKDRVAGLATDPVQRQENALEENSTRMLAVPTLGRLNHVLPGLRRQCCRERFQ